MQDALPVVTLVGFALLLWLLLVRPQARRQRELAHLQSTLEVGDEVVLTSGVFGTVRGLDEAVAEVEIADGVTIRVARAAVGQLRGEPSEPDDTEPDQEHDAEHTPEHTPEHGTDLEVPEEN